MHCLDIKRSIHLVFYLNEWDHKNREGERVRESFKNLDQKVSLGYRCTKMFDWCLLLKAAAFY